jgi:hypothetical protein
MGEMSGETDKTMQGCEMLDQISDDLDAGRKDLNKAL